MKDKKISVVHLYYLIIFMVTVISFFLVIAFGGIKNASTVMGTAATVSSLILSVIAIVMTIVDVAGQRGTVGDIKESAEKLQTNLSTVNESIEEIGKLKADLMESMREINIGNQSIIKEISTLKGKYEKSMGEEPKVENQEILNDLNQLSEQMKKLYLSPSKYIANNKNYVRIHGNNLDFTHREKELYISELIYDYIQNYEKDKFTLKDMEWILAELNISRSQLKREFDKLVNKKVLTRDGEFYVN